MDKCPYCGAETRPGDNFCLNCGNRLLASTPSPQQAQPAIGDATLPEASEWTPSNAGFSSPAQGSNWSDANLLTIANTSSEPETLHPDGSDADGSAAPVAQATLDKIENPAHLILRADNGEVLQDYLLEKFEVTIGRAPTSDVLLSKDKLTSRRHATIHYENGDYVLRDERSANGTFVNGQQIEEMTPRTLQDGDHIGIGEHELIFQAYKSPMSGVDIESMPTITVGSSSLGDMTYRTREDELLTAATSDDFSTRSMNGGADSSESEVPAPAPEAAPPQSEAAAAQPVTARATSGTPGTPVVASTPDTGMTFNRLTGLPQPTFPDVAPLMAALATLDGQVSSLQEQLNATQEAMRNHEADIAQITGQLRTGVRRVAERMDNTIADVARSREQLAWAELTQLMDEAQNNPRDYEFIINLGRKSRELNKVFQIHQSVLNTLAECTSLLRSLIGEDK
ncbi:MAG TPA: FHA domain-containing protein [Ktedonobacteraceae bacterium]|nr:FHA domain-containing protein [Ktedonobacteraceae bacterium]